MPVAAQELVGIVRVDGRPAKNVVVWLDVPGAAPEAVKKKVVMDQRNLQFSPRVLAVPTGTSVELPNSDRVFHNVFSFHDGKVFDLGLYPAGTSKKVVFDKPGLSRIFCNIHPNMAAYVLAVDSTYVGVSDAGGQFTLPPVAQGSYTYHAWRAESGTVSGSLSVEAGRPLSIALP
jgi:plastocyanin